MNTHIKSSIRHSSRLLHVRQTTRQPKEVVEEEEEEEEAITDHPRIPAPKAMYVGPTLVELAHRKIKIKVGRDAQASEIAMGVDRGLTFRGIPSTEDVRVV